MDNQSKKLLACAKCYKLHRKCTGESRPCDYCKERKLECVENPDRKKRGRPKGSKNKYKSTPQMNESLNYELQNIMEITRKRNLNNFNNSFSQYSNYEDPRIYLEYQKRQKISPNEIYAQQQYPMQYTIPNNNTNATIPYINNPSIPQYQDYYGNNNNLPQYIPQRIISPMNNNNAFQTQGQEIIYVEQNGQFPSTDFPNTYPPTQSIQQEEMLPKEDPLLDHSSKSIPINTQSRDLIYIPEKTSFSSCNTKSSNGKCCIKCQTEMHSFKFCPQCGTPREKFESKSLLPSISRRKLLSLAILDIVNENNPFMKDRESSLQTIWFVVRHPRLNTSSSSSSSSEGSPSIVPSSPNIMSDFSLFNTIIKQVSPNWTTLLGYKSSESEKIPLSKFIPSKIEFSPKVTSQWESLTDHTSRSSTVNLSCEFVLCHKFGLMFGVELQITCFSNNGLPDTSFIVVKRHWNLMNTSEATEIFNNPNLEYLSDKAIMDEEEEEESINDPNYELLRKAVDYKDVELF